MSSYFLKVRRTLGWSRPTSTQPNTPSPLWSDRKSFRAASSPLTLIFASTGTLATSQVMLNAAQSCNKRVEPFCVNNNPKLGWAGVSEHGRAFLLIFSGIDLAFIENGFIYHTKYDTADRILTDSIQRAGEATSHTCTCHELSFV